MSDLAKMRHAPSVIRHILILILVTFYTEYDLAMIRLVKFNLYLSHATRANLSPKLSSGAVFIAFRQ